jgi:hypothetical protein
MDGPSAFKKEMALWGAGTIGVLYGECRPNANIEQGTPNIEHRSERQECMNTF